MTRWGDAVRNRMREVVQGVGIVLAIGVAYYLFYRLTGIGVKCPVNLALGVLCPTCGVSRMFLTLSRLDFRGALYYNAAVLVLLIPWLAVLVSYFREYIRTGDRKFKRWHTVVGIVSVVVLVAYGVVRNVFHIGLHPSLNEDYEFAKIIFDRRNL